jgi:hypothetical protein
MFPRMSERLRRVGLIVLQGSLDESSVLVARHPGIGDAKAFTLDPVGD